jgi:hypothetical protein
MTTQKEGTITQRLMEILINNIGVREGRAEWMRLNRLEWCLGQTIITVGLVPEGVDSINSAELSAELC